MHGAEFLGTLKNLLGKLKSLGENLYHFCVNWDVPVKRKIKNNYLKKEKEKEEKLFPSPQTCNL